MKTIFVPSDFSENATAALKYAMRLCKLLDGKLIVFHCLLPPIDLYNQKDEDEKDISIKKELETASKRLQQQVNDAGEKTGMTKAPFATKIGVDMNPLVVEKIIETATAEHADLIVMGTHGASGLNKFLFGSNTSNVIAKSDTPVLAIPADYEFRKIERIVMASDLSDFRNELNKVVFFGEALEARIDIVYLDYGIDPLGEKEYKAIQYMEKIPYQKMRFIKQKATIEKTLIRQLKACISEEQPQWLVMFPREQNFWDKILLHSKTERMLNTMKLPLLSMKRQTKGLG